MAKLVEVIKLMRVSQYTKNLFIFLPAFFGQRITHVEVLGQLILAFIGFSLISSAIYIFNDYHDIDSDRRHPIKRYRSLASGKISINFATNLMFVLLVSGAIIEFLVNLDVLFVALMYLVLNMFYSIKLKDFAIIDVILVSFGFVLRIFVGGFAAGVVLQPWIIAMTFLLALFLGLAKRRDDLILEEDGINHVRRSLKGYNKTFLDYAIVSMASITIVAYLLYTLSPDVEARLGSYDLFYTTIFVIFGMLRYLQIIFVEKNSGSPSDILLKDRKIQLVLLAWLISFGLIIYL